MFMQSKLVGIYAQCGCMDFSFNMFDEMFKWNVVTWTALLVLFFVLQCNVILDN